MRPLRLLLVEDSESDATLLIEHLRQGGYDPQYTRIDSAEALSKALEHEWDVVIADYTMPGFSGTAALSIVRERGLEVPFIFVSGTIGEDVAVEAMKHGADDYIIKNNLNRLIPAINRELRDAEVRRERTRAVGALGAWRRRANRRAGSGGVVMLTLRFDDAALGRPLTVLVLGAHSDDIEIGCGGTLLRLAEERPDASVYWTVAVTS